MIVGNGNVALDVARVLLMGSAERSATDIADHALDALHASTIDEVTILARRGLAHAAFSLGEFLALGHLPGVDVIIEGDPIDAAAAVDFLSAQKIAAAREYAQLEPTPGNRRIVFRFGATPAEVIGADRVTAVRLADGETIDTSLLLRSIGYRGTPID